MSKSVTPVLEVPADPKEVAVQEAIGSLMAVQDDLHRGKKIQRWLSQVESQTTEVVAVQICGSYGFERITVDVKLDRELVASVLRARLLEMSTDAYKRIDEAAASAKRAV